MLTTQPSKRQRTSLFILGKPFYAYRIHHSLSLLNDTETLATMLRSHLIHTMQLQDAVCEIKKQILSVTQMTSIELQLVHGTTQRRLQAMCLFIGERQSNITPLLWIQATRPTLDSALIGFIEKHSDTRCTPWRYDKWMRQAIVEQLLSESIKSATSSSSNDHVYIVWQTVSRHCQTLDVHFEMSSLLTLMEETHSDRISSLDTLQKHVASTLFSTPNQIMESVIQLNVPGCQFRYLSQVNLLCWKWQPLNKELTLIPERMEQNWLHLINTLK